MSPTTNKSGKKTELKVNGSAIGRNTKNLEEFYGIPYLAEFFENTTLKEKTLRDYLLKAKIVFKEGSNFEAWLKLPMLQKTSELYNWFMAEKKRIMKEENIQEYKAHNRARTYAIRVCGFCKLALAPNLRVNSAVFPQNMEAPVKPLEFGYEELEKILEAIEKEKDRLIFRMICLFGTLPSDLVKLELRDITTWNEDFSVIQKARVKTKKKGGYWITLIPKELMEVLNKHVENNQIQANVPIFPISANAITKMVGRACDRAGIDRITIQQIRKFVSTKINKALQKAEKDFEDSGDTDLMIDSDALYAFWTAHKHATIEKQVKNNNYITDSIDDMIRAFPYVAERVYLGTNGYFKKQMIEVKKEARELVEEQKEEIEKLKDESLRNANEDKEQMLEFMRIIAQKNGVEVKPRRAYTNDLNPKEKNVLLSQEMKDLMRKFTSE